MAKDLKLVILLDFYGGLLTDKQMTALDYYYNQDYSLSEIGDEMGISRQGVMAFIRQGEKHLRAFEEKLGLAERFGSINARIEEMREVVESMEKSEAAARLTKLINTVSEML